MTRITSMNYYYSLSQASVHSLLILLLLSLIIDARLLRRARSPKETEVWRDGGSNPKSANASAAENVTAENSTTVVEHAASRHKTKGGHHDGHNSHQNKTSNKSATTTAKPDVGLVPVECGKEYVVQPGETCSAISSEFGLTRDEFLSLNPEIECKGGLKDGMSVCIRKKKKRNSSEETDGLNALINGEQVDEDAVKGDFDILLHGK